MALGGTTRSPWRGRWHRRTRIRQVARPARRGRGHHLHLSRSARKVAADNATGPLRTNGCGHCLNLARSTGKVALGGTAGTGGTTRSPRRGHCLHRARAAREMAAGGIRGGGRNTACLVMGQGRRLALQVRPGSAVAYPVRKLDRLSRHPGR